MNSDDLLIGPDQSGLEKCAKLLSEGGLVAFPTETVYGLGANALNEAAVHSIFTAKGRPLTDPLIVHVVDQAAAQALLEIKGDEITAFQALGGAFWPGPLTLIAKASNAIPSAVTADTGFVGVRVPAHPLAMALLQASKLPIAAPSANRFGHVSPTRANHVLFDLAEKGVHVLDGDGDLYAPFTCQHGIESTVAKINGHMQQVQIFRQGAVTQPKIEAVLESCGLSHWTVAVVSRTVKMAHTNELKSDSDSISNSNSNVSDSVKIATVATANDMPKKENNNVDTREVGQEAPGQAITHYAPDVPCSIVAVLSTKEGSTLTNPSSPSVLPTTLFLTKDELRSVVIIDFAGQMSQISTFCLAYRDLSSSGCSAEGARNLFEALRWAELISGATKIFLPRLFSAPYADESVVDSVPAAMSAVLSSSLTPNSETGDMILGLADRIFRAASGVIIHLVIDLSSK